MTVVDENKMQVAYISNLTYLLKQSKMVQK